MQNVLFSVGKSDFVKGLAVAVLTAVLTAVNQSLQSGAFDWNQIGTIALTAFVAYLSKNFLSDEQGKIMGHWG